MAPIDTRCGTAGESPFQAKGSRNIHACVISIQRSPVKQPFMCYGEPLQPSGLPLSLAAHQALTTPSSCEEQRPLCCCRSWVRRDSFEAVDVTGSSICHGLWRSIEPCCRACTNDVEYSNKNPEATLRIEFSEPAYARSFRHDAAQAQKFPSSHVGRKKVKLPAGNGRVEFGELFLKECRTVGCRRYADQPLSETGVRGHDRFSVLSWWNCCSRAVTLPLGSRLGLSSCGIPSRAGREKRLHYFVYLARRNFWGPLQKIATRATTNSGRQDYSACEAGVKSEHTSARPRDASASSTTATNLRQHNEKAIQNQHRFIHARGDVFEESASDVRESERGVLGHYFSQRRSSDNSRFMQDIPFSPQGAPASATDGHVLGVCSKISRDFDSADHYQMGIYAMSTGMLEATCVAADQAGAFILSLFLKRICVLLKELAFLARLMKEFDAVQERRQPQAMELVQMTLLGIVEIALLALQEPRRDCFQPFHSENGQQQQLFPGSEADNGITCRGIDSNEKGFTGTKCTIVSEAHHEARENTLNPSHNWIRIPDDSSMGRNAEDVFVKSTKDDPEHHLDQLVDDLERTFMNEIRSLKEEVRRLEKNVQEKKRKLVKAMARRHRLLNYAANAKKLTGEYHRRRRLLCLLQGPIRRVPLLRGHGKRCPCLFHNMLARRNANLTAGFEGHIWQLKTGSRVKDLGLDTQPVGHANQVFHSTLRKAQTPFRSVYDVRTGRGFYGSMRQGVSCEHEGARKDCGSEAFVRGRKPVSQPNPSSVSDSLSSSTPSISLQRRRASVILEGKLTVSPRGDEFDFFKKLEDVSDIQENHKEVQALLSEVGNLIEEYMGKSVEDGLPHDFRCFYDLRHIGGHSVMPPLNAAAEKENGWKQKRMLFFIESFIDLLLHGGVSEEQAVSFVESVLSLVEQTKVEQCDLKVHFFAERLRKLVLLLHSPVRLELSDAELRNLLPATRRACPAEKAITDGTSVGNDHSEEREPVLNTSSRIRSPAGLRGLPPPPVTPIPNDCQDATGDAVSHLSESVEGSALRKGCKRDERDTERSVLETIPHQSTLMTSPEPAEAGPGSDLHWNVAVVRCSTSECLHRANGPFPPTKESDAVKDSVFKDSRPECDHNGFPAAGKTYPPLLGRLSIFWLQDQRDMDTDWGMKGNDAVPALLLLPASASKQPGASLKEKLKGLCRVGLASVIEEKRAANCRAEGCSPGSLAAVQWISCYVGLLNDFACDRSAEVVSLKGASTMDVASRPTLLLARSAGDQHEVGGTQLASTEGAEEGLNVFGIESSSRNRILADLTNTTNVQLTSCNGSDSKAVSSIVSEGYREGSLREKFSLLGRTSLVGTLLNDFERFPFELSPFRKANELLNPPGVESLTSSSRRPEHTMLPLGPQKLSGDCFCSAAAAQRRTTPDAGCAEDANSLAGHNDVRESTTVLVGFASGEEARSLSVRTEGRVVALAEPQLAELRRADAEEAFTMDHSLTTPSVKTTNVGESAGIQDFVENSPRSGITGVFEEVVKDEQNVLNPAHVTRSIAGMDSVKQDRCCRTNNSDGNCDRHGNNVYVPLEDCGGIHLHEKEREAPQTASGKMSSTIMQKSKKEEACSAVAARKKNKIKKLVRKKCTAKSKRGSPVSSTKKTGTDHKEEFQRTRSSFQHKSCGSPLKRVNGYPAGVEPSPHNVEKRANSQRKVGPPGSIQPSPHNAQKRANGQRKGTFAEKKTPNKSTKR